MKKIVSIIFINIFLVFLVLIFIESLSFHILNKKDPNFHYMFLSQNTEEKYKRMGYGRAPITIKNGKGSILFFGCCITEGFGTLNDKDLISSVFSRHTKRTVYNRAYGGWGLQHMYYQLTSPDLAKKIEVAPDYIVYTIIRDHYRRLFSNSSANEPNYLRYKIKDGKFIRQKESVLNRSLFVYLLKEIYCQHNFDTALVNKYLIESYKKAKILWPNVNMIVLNIEGVEELKNDKELEQNGITVIDVTKYTEGKTVYQLGGEYCADKDCHPSGKYWEMVVPQIVSDLKIK